MDQEQNSEWKAPSQDAEQPDEHGLCWRETAIGLLAFKTAEDGATIWFQFDSNGNGTRVVFDESGQAFYLEEDKLIPVLPLESDQPTEKEEYEQPAPPVHSLDQASQLTFGRGTTASQKELMTEPLTPNEPQTNADSDHNGLFSSGAHAINKDENLAERREGALRYNNTSDSKDASKLVVHKESPQNACKFGLNGSPSFASGVGARHEIAKKAKRLSFCDSVLAVQKPAGDVGELLSLWRKTNAPPAQTEEEQINNERLLARLQHAGIQERLEKVNTNEKAFSFAFENQLTVLNEEMERIQSTVTFAEQKLEQCYEAHRKFAELQTSILTSWPLAGVMQNVAKRAEAFLRSSPPP